jgi:Flp pilus assembly protein TadG
MTIPRQSTPTQFDNMSAMRLDERGSVAIMFALMAFAIVGMAMSAVDYARIERMRANMQVAADTAADAAAEFLGIADEQIEPVVKAYLIANLPPDQKNNPYSLSISPDRTSLTISLQNEVPTTILRLIDLNSARVVVESTAERTVDVAALPTDEDESDSNRPKRRLAATRRPPRLSGGNSLSDMQANQEKVIEYLRSLDGHGDPEIRRLLHALQQFR